MILERIKKRILGTVYQGIDIVFKPDDDGIWCYLLELQDSRDGLVVVSTSNQGCLLEDIFKVLNKNAAVFLSFSGDGIFTKQTPNAAHYKSKLLFNANPEDFYWHSYFGKDTITTSITRKAPINAVLDQFKNKGYFVFDIGIAPLVGVAALQSIAVLNTLHIGNQKLSIAASTNQDLLVASLQAPTTNSIGTEKIPSANAGAFATILNYWYPNEALVFDTHDLQQQASEFTYKRFFEIFGVAVIALFLTSLLASYAAFNFFNKRDLEQQTALALRSKDFEKLQLLKKDLANKQSILKESGVVSAHPLSFYAYQVLQEIPKNIQLTHLAIYPTKKVVRNQEKIQFQNRDILLEGVAFENEFFSTWVKHLKTYHWITHLEITSYIRTENKNQFKIKLSL